MAHSVIQKITRTALLLAVTLLLQGLRLVIPVPPQISLFFIGSLVNACLVIAVLRTDLKAGSVIAVAAPVFAYLEGMLPLPFFIPVVAVGNLVYVVFIWALQQYGLRKLYIAAFLKAIVLFGGFSLLFALVQVPPKITHMILFAMSWPQIVTGIIGLVVGYAVSQRLKKVDR
ncbi:hypothetical protein HMPREF1039_1208 [Megasphaera lornae]|uniref:ECF transporter S component n=1 Tax=Megasphaera lornae TaxID=1000568 RepID=D3LX38_9FIRM|nr:MULTISPECIES: hypothetical protein [Megasphaera]EFD93425.1 hypothetical protein HMPREF0889_0848 [Megasphaera genomosp. type_1 str. 28L]EGL39632.1 hypothetical protein HMPREF1039_1208 [Megasphaera lornae]